jgi:aspartyl-tRNA synthetase
MTFIDLRDRYGITQLVFNMETRPDLCEKARKLGREYVLQATGKVAERSNKNPKMPTGEIEILVEELNILNPAKTPPFTIEEHSDGGDDLRMKYRYLDLRRTPVMRNLELRHRIAMLTRNYLSDLHFLEIETPCLIKSTPEGARDFVVPSRMNPGQFYALPQSPQQYKQLLMVAGYDRYFQLARCFRDEDLRADRQPEFTQIDLEMSFADESDIMEMVEGFFSVLFSKLLGKEIKLPIRRMTFRDAMNNYGSDKPDLRFGMQIQDISDTVAGIAFPPFADALASGGSVRAIVAENGAATLTRKEMDKLTETVRGIGAKGLAYIRWTEEALSCPFSKFLGEGDLEKITAALGMKQGDAALIVADKNRVVLPVLGQLRNIVARKLDMIKEGFEFTWITEMPFFEYDDESGKWLAMHHPFTMPLDECLPYIETDPENVRAKAYDLVLNGTELLSGSIRITNVKLQQKMFELLGLTDEEIDAKFGFLVDGYKYGAPPHGGAGIGLDRIAMILCGADSLRDVVAFPKVQNASELMSGCPAVPDAQALADLAVSFTDEEK